MFALTSNLTIGRFNNVKPNNVKINKSIYSYVDTAIIKLPASARLNYANKDDVVSVGMNLQMIDNVETAKQFNEGDKVNIKLGYNSNNNTEFEGFISRINFTSPVEVECEGYSYQLRKRTYTGTYTNIEVKSLLQLLIKDTDIVLDTNIADIPIDKIVIEGKNGTEVLESIKKISNGAIYFFFTGKVLSASLMYLDNENFTYHPKAVVNYQMGWNVIRDNNLKKRDALNADVTVNVIGEKKDGSKIRVVSKSGKTQLKDNVIKKSASAGSTGETKTIVTHAMTSAKAVTAVAQHTEYKLTYTGYEGKITAFLQPYCEPGYTCALTDKKFNEREGNYLIDSIEVTYGMQGARRIVGLAFRLN